MNFNLISSTDAPADTLYPCSNLRVAKAAGDEPRRGHGGGPGGGGPSSSPTEPLIRRGTHSRVRAVVERAIDAFLALGTLHRP